MAGCTPNYAGVLDSSRCYHYKYFKGMLNVEYLRINIPLKFKTALANFRCSNTNRTRLQENIDLHDRLCTYCLLNDNLAIIECEYHAFFICGKYLNIRQSYLFSWYTSDICRDYFYFLMLTNVIRKISNMCF